MQVRVPSAEVPAMIGTRPAACLTTTSSTRRPLVLLEPGDLAGDAERGQSVGALVDEEVDDAPLAGLVEVARNR